jgi:histidyl-tRNA synthetase
MKIEAPKGTADILPAESAKWQAIEAIARQTAELYHFSEIRTPVFEHTELFHRGVGETTDVVSKETYTFIDRGDRSITLRPEGTAGVVRAMIEHNLLAQEGSRQKVFYISPNFRYERPQKGRLRQHHQFGAEAFGVAEPEQDVECILLQLDFYRRCGLKDLKLKLNSLGDAESKAKYRDALVKYFEPHAAKLSEDSQRRLRTNPIRILDSKDPRDIALCDLAPSAGSCLSDKSRQHFDRVLKLLDLAKVEGQFCDSKLVRGFDYYTDTLWEITAAGLGAQDAVGGGGRYDNLVADLGGRPTPAVGFGSGLERLLIALAAQNVSLPDPRRPLVWLIAQGDEALRYNLRLIADLRSADIACDMDLSGRSLKAQFKLADRESATVCLITGPDELKANHVLLKNMKTGDQSPVPRDALIPRLRQTT